MAERIIKEAESKGLAGPVHVTVGELCEVTPEEVESALKEIAPWDFSVREEKGLVACSCSYKGKPRILERGHGFCLFSCPKCGKKPDAVKGGSILIGVE